MTKPTTARERVAITLAVCLSLIIAGPMTVLAATGQLVNIIDPANAARQARVTAVGALQVQARLGIPSGAVHWQGDRSTPGYLPLGSIAAPSGLAITEIAAWAVGSDGIAHISIIQVQVDAASSCPTFLTGGTVVRRLMVPLGDMRQLTFPSPLFVAPASSGKRRCIAANMVSSVSTPFNVALSGYQYAP